MGFLGMRGTGDWGTDERPKSWREMILYLYPNGMAPLTAMLSRMKSSSVSDPEFNWWTKELPSNAGAITGIYTDAGLTISYTSGAAIGDTLYVKVAEATASFFRAGHQCLLRDSSDLTVDVVGIVKTRLDNGASSYLSVELIEADDNSTAGDLSDADRIILVGNANAEGAAMPDAISFDPTKWYNRTQIFRTPLEITGTALETKLRRNPQAYAELKREALEQHSIAMEWAFWHSVPSERTGENGKPIRTTLGIIPAIRGGYSGHGGSAGTVSNFTTDSTYAGHTWLSAGEAWLEEQLEIIFRYGKRDKLMFCGSGTLMALNQLVKNAGQFTFAPSTKAYGIDVMKWVTPLGTINLITHPLFSQEPTTRNIGVIVEPENLNYRYINNRDTKFIAETIGKTNTGYTRRDGIKEEFLTEAGLEYHHPVSWAYLSGFGSDNTV